MAARISSLQWAAGLRFCRRWRLGTPNADGAAAEASIAIKAAANADDCMAKVCLEERAAAGGGGLSGAIPLST